MNFEKFLKISSGALAGVLLLGINSAHAFTACQVTDVGGVDDKVLTKPHGKVFKTP